MTKGKPWTNEEEKELQILVKAGASPSAIAQKMGKTYAATVKKCERLGLVVDVTRGLRTSTSIKLPKDLPTIEEALQMLAGALKKACEPGLDKVEVQRLQVIATLARTYKDMFAEYLDYRGIEKRLVELEAKYAALDRKSEKKSDSEKISSS